MLGVTFVIPCLNEEETLGKVIEEIQLFGQLTAREFEILVVDNGSSDDSVALAQKMGARVVTQEVRGYGSALQMGIDLAAHDLVVMGDADQSYRFSDAELMLRDLDRGADLVVGNRFWGGIEHGAMPALHRYLGNPVLSFIGRLFFHVNIGDFHCGLRAFRRDSIQRLRLSSKGMEFASEMIAAAALEGLKITEQPVVLRRDGRSRRPHLRTWRDGWRHLRFLFAMTPAWLFIPPAIIGAIAATFLVSIAIGGGGFTAAGIGFSTRTAVVCLALVSLCVTSIWSLIIAKTITGRVSNSNAPLTEITLVSSAFLLVAGLVAVSSEFIEWSAAGFPGDQDNTNLSVIFIGILSLTLGGISLPLSMLLGIARHSQRSQT